MSHVSTEFIPPDSPDYLSGSHYLRLLDHVHAFDDPLPDLPTIDIDHDRYERMRQRRRELQNVTQAALSFLFQGGCIRVADSLSTRPFQHNTLEQSETTYASGDIASRYTEPVPDIWDMDRYLARQAAKWMLKSTDADH